MKGTGFMTFEEVERFVHTFFNKSSRRFTSIRNLPLEADLEMLGSLCHLTDFGPAILETASYSGSFVQTVQTSDGHWQT